jgi:hypothetical protein
VPNEHRANKIHAGVTRIPVSLCGNPQQREEKAMQYTTPNVLATVEASVAIQNGTGTGAKAMHKRDNPAGPNPSAHTSSTGAYEADE